MSVIYKYPFDVSDVVTFDLPVGAEILHAGVDNNDRSCMWARVHPGQPTEKRKLYVAGTGHPAPVGKAHLSTFNHDDFTWHVFQ